MTTPGPIHIVMADITRLPYHDVIVNAANASLRRGGGVCGAIYAAAGPELDDYMASTQPIAPGEVMHSPAYGSLRASWIIHAVGPIYAEDPDPPGTLDRVHRAIITRCVDLGAQSVAIPAISTGIYGYPPREAAQVSLRALREVAPPSLAVTLAIFDLRVVQAYRVAAYST